VDILGYDAFGTRPHFLIRNNGKKGLVTATISATYIAANGDTHSVTHEADSWDRDLAFAASGRTVEVPLSTRVSHPSGIASVTLETIYAEFDDGTRVGSAAETGYGGCLMVSREKTLDVFANAVRTYEAEGRSRQTLDRLVQDTPELKWLSFLLVRKGPEAVIAELKKPRQLRP